MGNPNVGSKVNEFSPLMYATAAIRCRVSPIYEIKPNKDIPKSCTFSI